MTKFLVNYMGREPGQLGVDFSDVDDAAFMQAWGEWAEKYKAHILDDGAPCGKTKLVSKQGISATENAITGYTIVEADSHEAAAEMFTSHPHVAMLDLSIEVMECPPIPGM